MLGWKELVCLALGFPSTHIEAPTEGELWSIMGGGGTGWVSGMDSTPLNCLGIYSSHIGDSVEPSVTTIGHGRHACMPMNVLYVWSDLTDMITKTND